MIVGVLIPKGNRLASFMEQTNSRNNHSENNEREKM